MNDHRTSEFISRHIGPSLEEQVKMLKAVGYSSMDQLIKDIVPAAILEKEELDVRDSVSEHKALSILKEIASKNIIVL